MTWDWQLWLSPRPRFRMDNKSEGSFYTAGDAARFDFLQDEGGGWSIRETHNIDNPIAKAGLSGPPLHIHLDQTEYFTVEQGTLGVITDNQEHVLTKEDGTLVIPPRTRHRFWVHSSSTESVIFRGVADPQGRDHILDENFLRNFQGFCADCHREGINPSFFALILIIYDAGTLLTPSFWLPLWILKILHHVAAYWIGQYFLGYKTSYPEYTVEKNYEYWPSDMKPLLKSARL